jgi:hypothetical protein
MSLSRNFIAGLGGAIALNILHESLKHQDPKMPRIDQLGEEAVQKGIELAGGKRIKNERKLYRTTLAADLISNAVYYSAIGAGGPKHIWSRAFALGIAGGTGAVFGPTFLGLNPVPVTKSGTTKKLTVGYYLFGALVTAAILAAADKPNKP